MYDYKLRNEIESENIRSYCCIYDGDITSNPYEIDDVRFWDIEEIKSKMGRGLFTPNFEQEMTLYLQQHHRD